MAAKKKKPDDIVKLLDIIQVKLKPHYTIVNELQALRQLAKGLLNKDAKNLLGEKLTEKERAELFEKLKKKVEKL